MPVPLTAWGLDVGTTSIKAIKLRREADSVVVEAFDVVEHDKLLTDADNRDEVIRATLGKFLERNPIRNEGVFISVPGNATFARFVKLPPVEPKKIPEIVRFEAIQQVPFPLDQVNWDYQTFSSPETPEVEVGIFAMKKELVAEFMRNFQVHSMIVEGVQIAPLAVYNAVMYDGITAGKGTVVIDIGAEHTDLIFCDAGRVWLRTINIGGNAFTDALSKSFKIPMSKAETLKRTAATSKHAKQIFQAMRPVFADLVSEIQRSIGFYNSSHRDSNLVRIVGMGNPFKLPNLTKYIQQELKMDIVRLESFHKAVAEGKLGLSLAEHILGMPAAYGLALQGLELATIDISLLPSELARQMLWRNKQRYFAAAAAMIAVGVGAIAFQVWNANRAFASASGDGSTQRQDNQKIISDAKSASSAFSAVSDAQYNKSLGEIEQIQALAGDRRLWPRLYTDLVQALPQADAQAATAPAADNSPNAPVVVQSIASTYGGDISKKVAATPTNAGGSGMPAGLDIAAIQAAVAAAQGAAATGQTVNMSEALRGLIPTSGAGAAKGPDASVMRPGFQITITGYVPEPDGRQVVKEFRNRLIQQIGEKDSKNGKPYYIDPDFDYSGRPMGPDELPWGKVTGPFYRLVAGPLLGLSQAEVDRLGNSPQARRPGSMNTGNPGMTDPNNGRVGGPDMAAIARLIADARSRAAAGGRPGAAVPPRATPRPNVPVPLAPLAAPEEPQGPPPVIDPFTKKPVTRYYSFTTTFKVYLRRGAGAEEAKAK